MPRPRCEPIEILNALGEQEPVELWRRGDRCGQIDAPLLRCLVVEPVSKRLMRCNKIRYSITSPALASSDGGTVRPSALAVLRLITNSYLVGACTGRSAGFAPLRMRST